MGYRVKIDIRVVMDEDHKGLVERGQVYYGDLTKEGPVEYSDAVNIWERAVSAIRCGRLSE